MIRIGYPCMNNSIGCTSASTFRLSSWSEKRFKETIMQNLDCLEKILQWNIEHSIYFFRITSDLVPFASHTVCEVDWQAFFSDRFARIGELVRRYDMRVSMHPGQYTVLNSNRADVVERSILELEYHTDVLDLMNQGPDAKFVLHVGGVYGNKERAKERFVKVYQGLSSKITKRLIIENDERSYTVEDCVSLHDEIAVPVVLDNLHHEANGNGEKLDEAFEMVRNTWSRSDGIPIVHYSSRTQDGRLGKHAKSIQTQDFQSFLHALGEYSFDLMLEVKDKEISALKAIALAEDMGLTQASA